MSNDDLDQLREELMVQEIMLDSLADVNDDAGGQEQKDIEDDIARLKRLIAKAERGELAIEDDDAADTLPGPQSADLDAQPSRPTPTTPRHHSRAQPAYLGTPASYQYGSNQAVTPQGRAIQTQPSSTSLSVRKRERSETNTAGNEWQSKSRRTTPPGGGFGFGSSASRNEDDVLDFIDLTGDDEYNSASIANSIRNDSGRFDNRNRLQASPSRGPRDPGSFQGQSNAFDRIMHTQQMNSGPMSFGAGLDGSVPSYLHNGIHDADDIASLMPGAYDSTWDDQLVPGLSANSANAFSTGYSQPTFGQVGPPHNRLSSTGPVRPPIGPGMSTPGSHLPQMPFGFNPTMPNLPPPAGYPGYSGAIPAPSQPTFASVAQRVLGDGSSLDSLINRTNSYDFINGVDGAGNPLPGRMQDIWSQMQDPKVTEKELEDLLTNIRPDMDIEDENREKTPPGLKTQLYLHQQLALSWLRKMEEGTNNGGILADDMGLGKTISMIALMSIRPATSRPKTNLIIAPVALMRQWEEEIKTKLRPSYSMSTFIYHGKKATTEELLQYDVVLTTYGTLAAEHKRLEKITEESRERTIDLNDKMYASKIPLLHPHKAKFHRIVLDEAQCIKNDKSLTAKAAFQLRGVHRWCLTGTPMMNGVHELYSLLKFLQIRPYKDKHTFNDTFKAILRRNAGSTNRAMERLRVLLKAILLRRMKNTKINGKPIIDLPPKTEELVHVELSSDERDYYMELERKSQVIFNKYLRENTVGKNYSNVLVLLLRLRQACCHPHLNYEVEDSEGGRLDNEKTVRELDDRVVQRIKGMESFECPVCYDAVPNPSFFVPCGHDGCQECLVKIIDSALASAQRTGESENGAFCKCPECRTQFDPKQCFTYETFKKIHMAELLENKETGSQVAREEETEYETDTDEEADGDDDVDEKGNLKGFIEDDDFFDSDEDDKTKVVKDEKPREKKKKLRKKKNKISGKGSDETDDERQAAGVSAAMLKTLRKEAYRNHGAYKKYMAYLRKNWLPSAKVTECMKLLNEIGPTGEKTIIFSQWTLLLDLLQVAMHHEGFEEDAFGRYDGTMSADARVDAARAFQKEGSKVKTILVSLRAGNAGLNLTTASRVIILDPFWNPYIEMQAVDRAYRIGQQREVKVYRILTTETVEDRIMNLQARKKEIVESALDESESKKIARLSTSELRYLFNGS